MAIKKIGVVGAGSMGSGIAHLAARSGFEVVLRDVTLEAVNRAIKGMEKLDVRAVEKGKMPASEAKAVLTRIQATDKLEDLASVDFVIEAVFENMEVKKEVFSKLDSITRPEIILATNTSSMSITEISKITNRPERVTGMHFFNPAQVMRLVEVIRGYYTSDETVAATMELSRQLTKEPVEVKIDSPGFIVNRCLMALFIEAFKLLEEGVATVEDIDKAVTLGLNHPMGPFTLADFTGLDISMNVIDYFYQEFKDPKYASPQVLKRMIKAGRLGKKTGAGFYENWDQPK